MNLVSNALARSINRWRRFVGARRIDLRDQSGVALIEVLVSAIILALVAGGVVGAITTATSSTAEERHRAQAHAIAEEDQARMRSLTVSALSNLTESTSVTVDGSQYTLDSTARFVTDATGTATCASGTAEADYIKIVSTVTWPSIGVRPPIVTEGIVAPPNGSIADDHGGLAIRVEDRDAVGVSGISFAATGPASFSGTTDVNGCALFGNLPAGNYTLVATGEGVVDRDGNPPGPQTVSVVGQSTNIVVLQYDLPGSIDVSFTTRIGGSVVPSTADSIIVFNTGMTTARSFGAPTPHVDSRVSTLTAIDLFPFSSPQAVYAGSCTGNNPNPTGIPNPPAAAAIANVNVQPGGSHLATIQLPSIDMTVRTGTSGSPGPVVPNAHIHIADRNCTDAGGAPFQRSFNANAAGRLQIGLPYSNYDICADNGTRMRTATNVAITNLAAATTLNQFLNASGSTTGVCP